MKRIVIRREEGDQHHSFHFGNSPQIWTLFNSKGLHCLLTLIDQMVDIIAAIPEEYKNLLTPFLKVKPVRTASGVAVVVCDSPSLLGIGRYV